MWNRRIPSANDALPNLVIIGAQKCATSSLHYYLGQHPDVFMSREKELDFFVSDRNWDKGLAWYRSHFRAQAAIRGEASPGYTNYPLQPGVAQRMASVIPEARLIYIVRDPIERIISQYVHLYAGHWEDRSLSEVLRDEEPNEYLCRSRYYMQLCQYLPYYSADQILLLTTEELRDHRLQTLRRVFRFLGIDDRFDSPRFATVRHRSTYKRRKNRVGLALDRTLGAGFIRRLPPSLRWPVQMMLYGPFSSPVPRPILSPVLRRRLADDLKEDADQLRAYTGRDLTYWSV